MRSLNRRPALLLPLALLLACGPESDEVVFQLQAHSFANSEWSTPVNLGAAVNSSANEMNAALSADELSLYFVSTRPGGFGGADIWVSRRASLDSPWEAPLNLGSGVNTAGLEASPALSIDGHLLFFSSDRPGGFGSNDIYVARRADKSDDLYLVRGPNTVTLDIYVAPVNTDGEPLGPTVLVAELSDLDPAVTDAHPSLRTDGREVYIHSNRAGSVGASDLWRSTRRSVHEPWSPLENVGAPLSTSANDFQPTLTYNARTLIFASNRAGGLGGNDIWMSTRTPSGQ